MNQDLKFEDMNVGMGINKYHKTIGTGASVPLTVTHKGLHSVTLESTKGKTYRAIQNINSGRMYLIDNKYNYGWLIN